MQYNSKLVLVTIRDVFLQLVASKLRLSICYLLPAICAISRCDSISSFSHTGKMAAFQTLKNKQNKLELADTIDYGEFSSVSLESLSVVASIKNVCYLYGDNKSAVWINNVYQKELEHISFTTNLVRWF